MKRGEMKKIAVTVLFAAMACTFSVLGRGEAAAASKYVRLATKFKTLEIGDVYRLKLQNNTLHWIIQKAVSNDAAICRAQNKGSYVRLAAKSQGRTTVLVTLKTNEKRAGEKNGKLLKCRVNVKAAEEHASAASVDPAEARRRIEQDGFTVSQWSSDGQIGVDENVTHGSEYSYYMETDKRNVFRLIKQYPVKKDTWYIASAYIKTENLVNQENQDMGANISCDYSEWCISQNLMGDHDWTKISLPIYSGEHTQLPISVNFGQRCNTCTGKMYVDQIRVEEYTPPDSAEWKMLYVVIPNSEYLAKDSSGAEVVRRGRISSAEIQNITKAVRQFETDSYKDSNGKLNVKAKVLVVDRTVTKLTETIHGPSLSVSDAYELIKDEVDLDQYDYVGVFADLDLEKPTYYGMTFFLSFHQGTGYMIGNIQILDFTEKCEWRPAIMMHEFLHFIMTERCNSLGLNTPIDLDHATDYGYQHVEEWRQFYRDIINQNVVLANGEKAGVPDTVWKITPKDFRYSRIR